MQDIGTPGPTLPTPVIHDMASLFLLVAVHVLIHSTQSLYHLSTI